MGTVLSSFSTSLDGFIAAPDGSVGPLFDWYTNGDVEVRPPGYPITFHMTRASADYWNRTATSEGAFVTGRALFDFAHGWGGRPPNDAPTFVVTHRPPPADWPPIPDAPFTFVGDLETAMRLAREVAGDDGDIGVAGPNLAQQCLNAGWLDEVRIDLVPVLLGDGIRYFDNLDSQVVLEDPEVVQGSRVTHLRYRVRR
ncbi:dihydrofolate reductase family protein [Jiangella mangrovi]|uniref:Dihydrofolate reductase n=1 Tax=Jiangella mangrovi TaxID=1524084 RepID=A0A7W9GTQ8_9ACTN|nr:dihydrofolate reductase family protein [Jiangella mangrovi]MBB5789516.1 dihydrofolate reductase [Jiangella mangrovi]